MHNEANLLERDAKMGREATKSLSNENDGLMLNMWG